MPKPTPHHTWGKGKHQSAHQKQRASETLLRLRREHPEKFIPHKKKPVTVENPPTKTEADPILIKASEVSAPGPAPTPIHTPAAPPIHAKPDTEIFGSESPQPPKVDSSLPPPKPPEAPPGSPGPAAPGPVMPADNRKLAVMVWAGTVNLFIAIFGKEMAPKKIEAAPGQVFDESEMMVSAWADYFTSIGIKPFSALTNLWLAHAAYVLPRFQIVVAAVKNRFRRKTPAPETAPSPPSGEPTQPEKAKEPGQTPPPVEPPSPPPRQPESAQSGVPIVVGEEDQPD